MDLLRIQSALYRALLRDVPCFSIMNPQRDLKHAKVGLSAQCLATCVDGQHAGSIKTHCMRCTHLCTSISFLCINLYVWIVYIYVFLRVDVCQRCSSGAHIQGSCVDILSCRYIVDTSI